MAPMTRRLRFRNDQRTLALLSMFDRQHPGTRLKAIPFVVFALNLFAFAAFEQHLTPSDSPLPLLWFVMCNTGLALAYLCILPGADAARALRVAILTGWSPGREVLFILHILFREAPVKALACGTAMGFAVHAHGAGASIPIAVLSSFGWYAGTILLAAAIVTVAARHAVVPGSILAFSCVLIATLVISLPGDWSSNFLFGLPVAGWTARALWSGVMERTVPALLWALSSGLAGCGLLGVILLHRE
jgi:hypothetical protein